MRTPSTSRPGSGRGSDPEQMITALALMRLAVDRNRTVRRQRAEPVHHSDLAALEQTRQTLAQVGDDAALAVVDRLPIRRRLDSRTDIDSEVVRMVHGSEDFRGLQQCLRRDAAAMQTGATDRQLFDQRHFLTRGGGVQGCRVTAGSAAHDDDVEIGHALATSRERLRDFGGLRHHRILKGRAGRSRSVLRRDSHHRPVQMPEASSPGSRPRSPRRTRAGARLRAGRPPWRSS